jgi:hypothetical protein
MYMCTEVRDEEKKINQKDCGKTKETGQCEVDRIQLDIRNTDVCDFEALNSITNLFFMASPNKWLLHVLPLLTFTA